MSLTCLKTTAWLKVADTRTKGLKDLYKPFCEHKVLIYSFNPTPPYMGSTTTSY